MELEYKLKEYPEDRTFAAAYSIAAHVILVMFFLAIRVWSPNEMPPFEVELLIGSVEASPLPIIEEAPLAQTPTPAISTEPAVQPTQVVNAPQLVVTPVAKPDLTTPSAVDKVAPDKMLPIFDDEDADKASSTDKPTDATNLATKPSVGSTEKQESNATGPGNKNDSKSSAKIGSGAIGEKVTPGAGTGSEISNKYLLEGLSQDRKPIHEELPPSSKITSEGRVKISFSVLPDGSISGINLLKKGDPTLDALTIEYFGRWKFNQAVDDKTQQGVITFIYKLR